MSDALTPSGDVRNDARRLIDALPADATWDDIMHGIYVRQCIERGLDDIENDRVVDVDEVRRRLRYNQ